MCGKRAGEGKGGGADREGGGECGGEYAWGRDGFKGYQHDILEVGEVGWEAPTCAMHREGVSR